MVTIPNLTVITDAALTDPIVVEAAGGTRGITRQNFMLRRSELTELATANLNITNDRILVADATDGFQKGVTPFALVFGNYTNDVKSDGFTLDPATDNRRVLELSGTFANPNITLSGATANIQGATFTIANFSTGNVNLNSSNGITMFENGTNIGTTKLIRADSVLDIFVRNSLLEAIVRGG